MFHPNQPIPLQTDSSALMVVDQNDTNVSVKDELQDGGFSKAESVVFGAKKLQDDLESLGIKIKRHEANIKLLKSQKNKLDESIVDLQVSIGKYQASSASETENMNLSRIPSEEETTNQILRHEKSAAGILCKLIGRHGTQVSSLSFTKDVLGIFATIGKVGDDNINRLLSEYLGLETMLAVICKTYEGVKALETYNGEGSINKNSGLHGLAASTGKAVGGRFLVICLENLRPYVGGFVVNDPQRRLDLLKPRLPNGECPPGFLGFAVNMIDLDSVNLLCVTPNGDGLRETLLYNLFSRLQVYRTRAEMLLALPCINEGALSLDGGIIRGNGVFSLGDRVDVDVRFRKSSSESSHTEQGKHAEIENQIKEAKWKREKILEDIQRERQLMEHTKFSFERKKQEFVKFLAASASTQASPASGSAIASGSAKPKGLRTKWSSTEEERLVRAWINNFVDSVHGNAKKGEKFWDAIGMEFTRTKSPSEPIRSPKNCKDHWRLLNKKVQEFHGCWVKCERLNQNGRSYDQVVAQAEEMYKQEYDHDFVWKHWWKLVKDQPKWNNRYRNEDGQSKRTKLDEVGSYSSSEQASTERDPTTEVRPAKARSKGNPRAISSQEQDELAHDVPQMRTNQAVEMMWKKFYEVEARDTSNMSSEDLTDHKQLLRDIRATIRSFAPGVA